MRSNQWFSIRIFAGMLNRPCRQVLSTSFDPEKIENMLEKTWQRFQEEKPDLPIQKTWGGSTMLQLAGVSHILFQVLLTEGKSPKEATELIFQISWKIYTRMGKLPMSLAKVFSKSPLRRVALSTQIFRKFPFSAPDYGWEDVVSENDTVAFNCTRCQVAEYFKQHDLGEFCYETWCKLDFPLAAQWGSKLDRKASIAIGAEVCDFRWTVPSKQEG